MTSLPVVNSSEMSGYETSLNCTQFTAAELDNYLSVEGGLTLTLAPRKLVPLTIIYVLIFVTGLVGNAVNCRVILHNRTMHTSTNFYLLNLSCSDLLTLLLGLPFELWSFFYGHPWLFGEWFCVFRSAAAETTTTVSILTITAFTIERYVAVSRPIHAHAHASGGVKRVMRVLVLIWAVALLTSGGLATQFGIVYMTDPNGCIIEKSALCGVKQEKVIRHSFELGTVMFFAPMVIIVVFCTLIAVSIHRSEKLRTALVVPLDHDAHKPCDFGVNIGVSIHSHSHSHSHSNSLTVSRTSRSASPSTAGKKISASLVAAAAAGRCSAHIAQPNVQLHVCSSSSHTKLTVNKMLFAVCAAFFICFAPFHISRVFAYFITEGSQNNSTINEINEVLYYIGGTFYYLNATVNPIIYNVMSKKFRREFSGELTQCIQNANKTLPDVKCCGCPSS